MSTSKNRKIIICKRCGNERYNAGKGFCSSCYNMMAYLARAPIPCGRCGKERIPFSRGMCKSCYQIIIKYPNATLTGTKEHKIIMQNIADSRNHHRESSGKKWKGGRFIDKKGYIRIINPIPQPAKATYTKRYLLEHRVIAETIIGRPLKKGEVVHHINLIKTDNRPKNLVVLANASEHRKIHAQLDSLVRGAEQRLRNSYES